MDNLRFYLDAQAEYDVVKKEVAELGEKFSKVGQMLKTSPTMVAFTNVPTSLPANAALSASALKVDGNAWPAADEIQQVLARFHAGQEKVRSAWRALSPQDRQHLKPLSL